MPKQEPHIRELIRISKQGEKNLDKLRKLMSDLEVAVDDSLVLLRDLLAYSEEDNSYEPTPPMALLMRRLKEKRKHEKKLKKAAVKSLKRQAAQAKPKAKAE